MLEGKYQAVMAASNYQTNTKSEGLVAMKETTPTTILINGKPFLVLVPPED